MNNLRMFVWLTILTGIIYPLLITGIAQLTMKPMADGNLIAKNGVLIGAPLIAQKFESDKYFWARPSAVDYNPLPSGGSNLGPTSEDLKKQVEDRKTKVRNAFHISFTAPIPSELLFASGSGLDPDISIPTAEFQIDRVSNARNIDKKKIKDLIDRQKTPRFLGMLGEEYVNVLLLNQALDELQ